MASVAHMPADASRDKNLVQVLHRVTVEHRHLWYQLSVLQQPERARACGAGVKANSDRRPVDPPPVVELKVFEGPSIEEGKHITFDYKANFFVYASLEHARTLAHGRVQTPAANCPPILSGVPATGMAYLDRPSEAGYFIFPDLSVRHEGNYCLNFSLFETTKDKKDYDVNLDPDMPPGVDFRMEIKTKPFTVYSAKKFPGLMESTELSKMVADQGCRVRIRRDVRMRKRDKSTRDYDRREEDYARRRTVTPATDDPHGLRPRSVSNSSEHRMPYPDPQRRPSLAESYPSAPPPPPPGFDGPPLAARSHLSFGDPRAPQYATPSQYAPHPPPLQVAPASPTGPYTPGAQSPHIKPDPHYSYRHSRPMPQMPSPSASIKAEYTRRSSGTYNIPPSPTTYSPIEAHSRRESYSSYPATPITAQPLPRMHIKPTATAPQMSISSLVSPAAPIEAQTEPDLPPPSISTGGKRKHDYVFPQSSAPLHNGRRPLDPTHAESRRLLATPGTYPRADGTMEIAHFNEFT